MKTAGVFFALFATALADTAAAHPDHAPAPPWQQATGWPDRIITTLTNDPATSFSVTWRTDETVGRTIAQIAPATPDARFDILAETVKPKTERLDMEVMETEAGVRMSPFNFGLGRYAHFHSHTFEGLEPDTLYAWRVQGERGKWSEWFQTRTAPREGPVEFVYFGDAQQGVRSHWSRVIRAASEAAPHANFYLHAGDLVMKGDSDYNWAEWFAAGSFLHARTPSIPVPGNHENVSVHPDDPDAALVPGGEGKRMRVRTPFWRAQFTLPVVKELPETLHENVYDIRYTKDLHVFVVDSARSTFREQADWLDAALKASDARWKIVSMHHPYFALQTFDRDDKDARRRRAFTPVIDGNDVDLVLTGHIHTYVRGETAEQRTSRIASGEGRSVKTVFAISASGAKSSDIYGALPVERVGDDEPDVGGVAVKRVAGNTPMFQVLRIDGDTLEYAAHMATGEVYDRFTLVKNEAGLKTLTAGEEAFGDLRLFDNTGPYREWLDLR
ncbi:MAG: FN3 domain-containing metallophosphoesterase family protein [Pseudomonadota bacterium]